MLCLYTIWLLAILKKTMKLGAGIFFTLLAFVIFMFGKPKLLKEYTSLQDSLKSEFVEGELAYLHGKITTDNITLIEDFVIASKENFTGFGKYNGFKPVEVFVQPVKFVDDKGQQATLTFEEIPYKGSFTKVQLLEEKTSNGKPVQLRGVIKDTPINVIGEVKSLNPLALDVKYSFTGASDEYEQFLEEGNELINYICGVILIVGILFLVWSKIGKKGTSRGKR